jgi:hypothetical protein
MSTEFLELYLNGGSFAALLYIAMRMTALTEQMKGVKERIEKLEKIHIEAIK